MIRDGILLKDNKYQVYVLIQDGSENCGEFNNEGDAIRAYYQGQKILNGNLDKIPKFYEIRPQIQYELVRVK